jgi:hypothetical protein
MESGLVQAMSADAAFAPRKSLQTQSFLQQNGPTTNGTAQANPLLQRVSFASLLSLMPNEP